MLNRSTTSVLAHGMAWDKLRLTGPRSALGETAIEALALWPLSALDASLRTRLVRQGPLVPDLISIRHQVPERAFCLAVSSVVPGWSPQHPSDVGIAMPACVGFCFRWPPHRWCGPPSATGHRRSRAGPGFPAAGRGVLGNSALPVVDPSLPAKRPGRREQPAGRATGHRG